MFYYNQYVRAQSLDEAYELYQKKPNFVLGGMLWLKMKNKTLGTAIDLCDLGLDQISDVMTIFRALGAKVQLHKAGIMDLDEFAALPRTTRDVLVSVIVPKNAKGVVYLSQRNQSTDFPVLTCAVANRSGRYVAVVGASPYMAEPVWDEDGILDGIADAKTDGNAALTDNSENNAKIDKFAEYVAEHIRFGSNIRAGAEYREIICRVLTRRAVTQSLDICDDIKHEH